MEGHRRSQKVMEGHGRSFPITRLTFQVRKVMVGGVGGLLGYIQPHSLSSGLWIWDLDFVDLGWTICIRGRQGTFTRFRITALV